MTELRMSADGGAESEVDIEDVDAVLSAIEDELGVGRPRPDLRLTDSIRDDIDLDSLSLMEAMTRVEERYGIEVIDDPRIAGVVTVGDLVTLIQQSFRDLHRPSGDAGGNP